MFFILKIAVRTSHLYKGLKQLHKLTKNSSMDLYGYLFSFFLLLATYIFIQNSKKNLPPGPIGLPLIGSLLSLGDRIHETLTNLAKTYGPLMTIKLGFNNVVVVSSAEMAKEILQKNEFMGRSLPDAVTAKKDNIFDLPWLPIGPKWKNLRKMLNTQVLTQQKLDSRQDLRNKMMENMIQRVVEARDANEAIDIGRLVFGTTVQLLSNAIFSIDMLHPNSNDMKELHLLISNILFLLAKPNLSDFFPFLRPFDLQGIKREIKVSYDRLHKLVDDMIDRHITSRSLGLKRNGDLLDTLLDLMEADGSEEGLIRRDVRLTIAGFFTAGTDPITAAVEWAMSELLQNPKILHKTKQEMKDRIPSGETVKEQDLPHLPYLKAVIQETMRLHTTQPFLLPHRAEQDVEISGYTIPKNTRVLINAWSISRDSKYWDEPNIFKPERFLNSEITDFRSKDFTYIPFSAGKRACVATNLAVRMESLILAILVQKFDWKLPDGLLDVDMTDKFGITLKKAQPLMAIPI